MSSKFKRIALLLLGIIFLVAGIIGLALPFLQGFLFIAIGLVLLSIVSSRVRAYVEVVTRRYPKLHAFVERIEKKITELIGLP